MANPVKLGQLDPTPSPQSVTDNPRITTEWMDSVSTVIEQLKFAIQGILGNPQAELLSSAAMSDLSDNTPVTLTPDITATAGTGNKGSRFDHVHNVPAAATGAVVVGATGVEGTNASFARSDHTHTLTAAAPVAVGNANAIGSAGTFAHSDHVHDLSTAGDTNYLRRDGGNTVQGSIDPDADVTHNLGSSGSNFGIVRSQGFLFDNPTASANPAVFGITQTTPALTAAIDIFLGSGSSTAPYFRTSQANNHYSASAIGVAAAPLALENYTPLNNLATATADYAMGGFTLTGMAAATASGEPLIHSLNPLNHMAAATGAYDMDGNTFTDLGGCTSSNAAVLTFTSNLTGSSGVNGINLTWDEGTTEASNEWIASLRYNDGSSTEDKFKFGFHNQPAATAQNTMYIPVGTGNTEGFTLSCGDDAAGLANINDANNTGFTIYPSNASGSIWFYCGGTNVLKMQKSDIIIRDDQNLTFSFSDAVKMRSINTAETAHNNGWFQTGFSANVARTGGWLRIDREGIAISDPTASTNHTNALWGVDYQGVIHTGHFGDFGTAPEDGGCGAAGWTDTSQNADQTGSDFVIFGGVGTGDNTTKGDIVFKTPDAGGSGTAPQSLTTKATLYREGDLAVQGFDSNIVNIDDTDSPYTILDTDNTIICDATNGAITVTLPAVASTTTGRRYNVKKIDNSANNVTVDGNGSETVDDATTQVITAQYDSITVQSDGSEWWVI